MIAGLLVFRVIDTVNRRIVKVDQYYNRLISFAGYAIGGF